MAGSGVYVKIWQFLAILFKEKPQGNLQSMEKFDNFVGK